MNHKAMIISADRPFFEALAAVIKQEGWTADRMDPAEEDDELAAPYDLLIFAPKGDDVSQLVQFSCAESFRQKPLLWVANSAPPGMGAGLTRITRLEVLNRLPTMLSRAALGVSLQPKSEMSAPSVAVKEDGAGAKRELKIPSNLTADMIDMRPASVAAAAAEAAPVETELEPSTDAAPPSPPESAAASDEAPQEMDEESTVSAEDDGDVDWDNLIPAQETALPAEEEMAETSRQAMFGAPVDGGPEPEPEPEFVADPDPVQDAIGSESIPPASESGARLAVAEAKVAIIEAKAEVAQAEARLMMAEAGLMKAEARLAAFE